MHADTEQEGQVVERKAGADERVPEQTTVRNSVSSVCDEAFQHVDGHASSQNFAHPHRGFIQER